MKRTRIVFIAGGALLSAATAFSSNPLPEDTMYAVRRMLRVAQKPFQDNLTLDYEVIELDYSLPEVFFGMIRGVLRDDPAQGRLAGRTAQGGT